MIECVVRMEMPTDCKACPFRDGPWCLVPGDWRDRYTMPNEGRSEHCPIICQLPDGHGDLIDASTFKENMDYVCSSGGWLEPVTSAVTEYVKKHIDAQTVIVPAERSET